MSGAAQDVEEARQAAARGPFLAVFGVYAAVVLGALVVGALTNLAGISPAVHGLLSDWAGWGWPTLTRGMLEASEHTHHGGHVAIDYAFSLIFFVFGLFLVWLRPGNWTARLLAVGLVGTAAAFNLEGHSLYVELTGTPVTALHFLLHGVSGVAFLHALLLFPDGRLVPRPARWFLWAVYGVGGVLTVVAMVLIGGLDTALPGTGAPVDAETLRTIINIEGAFFVAFFGLLVPAAGALAQRHRVRTAATQEQRQQSRVLMWALAAAFGLGVTFLAGLGALHGADLTLERFHELEAWVFRVFPPLFGVIPIALLVGILRYRLWDVDVVLARTLTYGGLAVFVTVVYIAIVVGVGTLAGRGDEPNLLLSILATAIVAVAFQPARQRAQRLSNRLVYGERATPYEVLSALSAKIGETEAAEELLDRVARLLAEGTGAERAGVWLRAGDELRNVALWPADPREAEPVALRLHAGELDAGEPGSHTVPVRHQGELLGALTLAKPHGEPLTPTEDTLVTDLAAQAGLVLRNALLTEDLKDRVEELRASRKRLVAAQDDERRRIERDLHDGGQQQLVGLKVKLGIARTLAERHEAQPVVDLLEDLSSDADEAVESLRTLAHGIYPPLLAAEGLPAAITARGARLPLPVEVEADGIGRYSEDVEAAAYFCCLEALQNALKYADASAVAVAITDRGDALHVRVTDDGGGFDPDATPHGMGLTSMSDRIDALGGHLTVTSAPGAGTTVAGEIPLDS